MTTMQEALADKFLAPAEVPIFLSDTADLMQRSYANEKYGAEGQSLRTGAEGAIPSKRQNKIRSGRSGRKAANGRASLQAVGGLSYRGPWDALKAAEKPADYPLCKLESERKAETGQRRVAGSSSRGSSTTVRPGDAINKTVKGSGSALLSAAVAKFKASQAGGNS